jgi:hypothetical protein
MDGKMTMTHEAKKILDDLTEKLTTARQRHDDTQSEAQSIAFATHVEGGEARKKLDRLNADAAKHGAEIMSLEAAITEARRRVNEALAAEAEDVARDKAQQALALLDSFAARGQELDEALSAFLAKWETLKTDVRQLEVLGYPPSTYALIAKNMQAAVATKLQFTELRQDFLAPHQRRNFVHVIEGWGRSVRMRAEARLKAKTAAKAA